MLIALGIVDSGCGPVDSNPVDRPGGGTGPDAGGAGGTESVGGSVVGKGGGSASGGTSVVGIGGAGGGKPVENGGSAGLGGSAGCTGICSGGAPAGGVASGGAASGGVTSVGGGTDPGPPLWVSAQKSGRTVGVAVAASLLTNAAYSRVAGTEFNALTPENEMKWEATEPRQGEFTFAGGDQLIKFAQDHQMKVKGHTLVWHSQLPAWVSALAKGPQGTGGTSGAGGSSGTAGAGGSRDLSGGGGWANAGSGGASDGGVGGIPELGAGGGLGGEVGGSAGEGGAGPGELAAGGLSGISTLAGQTTLTPEEAVRAAMLAHIRGVVGHFKGKIFAWDVVNEAFDDTKFALRSSPFLVLGARYIDEAFYAAHDADPDARLFYNDYNIEDLGGKSDAVYAMVSGMVARGVPIHGVGFQMHVETNGSPSVAGLAANFARFTALGLEVNISEMDVRTGQLNTAGADLATIYDIQRQRYRDIIGVCRAEPKCFGITFWGVDDSHSWTDGMSSFGAGPHRALLFDGTYQKKPAYFAVREALELP